MRLRTTGGGSDQRRASPVVLPPSGPLSAFTPAPRRGAGVGGFLLAIVTAGALAHVGVRLKGLEVAYDLGRERRIATELEEQRRRLQIEIGMLKDPGRVISIAHDKLNMGPPASEAIRRLGAGSLWRMSPPAAPPPAAKTLRAGSNAGNNAGNNTGKTAAMARKPPVDNRVVRQGQGAP